MKRRAEKDEQFAWAIASPGELLFICGPALPSVVSVFLTADGKAGLRMKKRSAGTLGAGSGRLLEFSL